MFEILYQICYVSSANEKFQQTELLEPLNQARQYNKNNNVTGLLLYDGVGTFLQTLEGEKNDVESLFSKIKMDEDLMEDLSLLMAENRDELIPILRATKKKKKVKKSDKKETALKKSKTKK